MRALKEILKEAKRLKKVFKPKNMKVEVELSGDYISFNYAYELGGMLTLSLAKSEVIVIPQIRRELSKLDCELIFEDESEYNKEMFNTTNKLWILAEIALNDLDNCISQGMEVDMEYWTLTDGEKICSVCLAGAILFCKYDIKPNQWIVDLGLGRNVIKRLHALDYLQKGDIIDAYCYINNKDTDKLSEKSTKIKYLFRTTPQLSSLERVERLRNEVLPYLTRKDV